MRKTSADLLNVVGSLRQQAGDAAALTLPGQAGPAPQSTATPGATYAGVPGATPGPTPGATPTPMTMAAKPTATPSRPAPRPSAPPAPASTRTYPISGRFISLTSQISGMVGPAIENEHADPSGDVSQRTTGGLLFWSRARNLIYFTDGFVTWVLGPNGVEDRPNDQLLDWEKSLPLTVERRLESLPQREQREGDEAPAAARLEQLLL